MTTHILSFDFALSCTGWCLVERNDGTDFPKLIEDGVINTTWAGSSQWWAPLRYLDFFRSFDRLLRRLRREHGENSLELAAEQVMWGGQSTPALFALHQRFWEWAYRLETRIIYLANARWFHILADKRGLAMNVRGIEGKGVAREAYRQIIGKLPKTSDVSDAWGVAYAANRFLAYVDGQLSREQLTERERRFFDSTESRTGPISGEKIETPVGLKHELNTNYFDWRAKSGKEKANDG